MQTTQSPPPSYAHPQARRKNRWWIPLIIILAIMAFGFFVMVIGFFAIFGSVFKSERISMSSHTVIQLHVPGYLEEYSSTNPFAILGADDHRAITFLDVINAIRRAKEDDRVVGLYFRSGALNAGFAKATEIRDALIDFKNSGKFIYAFLELGRELDYYFASVADSIFMPTEGLVELNGFGISEIFLKGTLAKLGVDVHVEQFEEYKSAGETYSRKNFSQEARESLRSILKQRLDAYVSAIADARELEHEPVRTALSRGVYLADDLYALGFIDAIRSESEARETILKGTTMVEDEQSESDNRIISLARYIQHLQSHPPRNVVRDKQIAVVFASGLIVPGSSGDGGLFGERLVASQTFMRRLRSARENRSVDAIIIRIDSPGGTVIAADAIYNEIVATRKVKPVYASMSDVAASGGYYIAMACDTIIAHPGTITGSIGVISTIPNFSGTLKKIEAGYDSIATSPSALFFDPLKPFSAQDKKKLHQMSAAVYKRFVARVAESRAKSYNEARAVAKGRVWTGADAHKLGLADTLGGFHTSFEIAKRRLGVPPGQRVRLRLYPEPEDPWDAFLNLFKENNNEKLGGVQALISGRLRQIMPLWDLLPESSRRQILYLLQLSYISGQEKTLMALPFLPIIE